MAIYSIGRRRVILGLLLTTVLLLTLDLRGNPVIDNARDGFGRVMDPVEAAAEVVTNPMERVWHGITNYDDLEQENLALQEQVDRLIGTQAAAEAAVIEGQELQALYSLPSLSGIETEVARVVGKAANNLDQVIEINKGSTSGIQVGMAVVNQAGLVGMVSQVSRNTSRVMLVTDDRYTVAVKVTSAGPVRVPSDSGPSGLSVDELEAALPPGPILPGVTLPDGSPAPDTTLPGALSGAALEAANELAAADEALAAAEGEAVEGEAAEGEGDGEGEAAEGEGEGDTPVPAEAPETTTTTTTTIPPAIIEKEYGALEGRGGRRLPQIRFLQDLPSLLELQPGDLVETAGGSESLAPTGIPVGRVINRADRPGSGGPLLDVQVHADLARLNFVRVVLYKPLSEVDQ
jgi:rod shape-determining protein MreC